MQAKKQQANRQIINKSEEERNISRKKSPFRTIAQKKKTNENRNGPKNDEK